jgi:protein-S-isoprenylcysteine O-methyltransferase Ste14
VKESTIFDGLLIGWFTLAVVVFILLFFIVAPYGRHMRGGWGYTLGNKLGWVLMEAASPVVFALCFFLGGTISAATIVFLIMWEAHYLHRAFIYPFSLRGRERRMPLAVVSFGLFFNVMNGYLNGRYISVFSGGYTNEWLSDPRFIFGVVLFIAGYAINRQADDILRSLRGPDESGYKVTSRGFYRWVSCPNYLGEVVIWLGWALATWSLPGLAFAVWTIANLVPRARANHAWYRNTFPDYPAERKALVPGVW